MERYLTDLPNFMGLNSSIVASVPDDYYNVVARIILDDYDPKEAENARIRQKVRNFNNSIKKVVFHDPVVAILWKDGTKTVVKCQKGDKFDAEKGLAFAIIKHMFGNTGHYNTIFDKWLEEGQRPE